jgi:transcription antitermination factor NusG
LSEAVPLSEYIDFNWHALHVRSRHEKSVFAQLEAKCHEVFLPVYTVRHKWADRWKTVSLPLFPGYVFCRFTPANRSSVLTTSGVIDLVRAGAEPACIDDGEIEAIQLAVNSRLGTMPYAGLAKGERVMMTGGPLGGLTGTLMGTRRNLRFVLSVELLQRSVLVEVDPDWIAPLEDSVPASYRLDSASEYRIA